MVTLLAGTDTIRGLCGGHRGNLSTTNSVSLEFVVANCRCGRLAWVHCRPMTARRSGKIGQNYTITATPATGFVFTNWTGGTKLPLNFLTDGPTVRF